MGELNFFLNRETPTASSRRWTNPTRTARRRQNEIFLKKDFWEQIASQRAPEIFFYVYAPSGDVGARRHALRAWAAPFNLKSVERFFLS